MQPNANPTIDLHPCHDFLLVEPFEMDEMIGSIYLPQSVRDAKPVTSGKIIEVGEGCAKEWFEGQHVMWEQYAEFKAKFGKGHDAKVLVFLREGAIMAASWPEDLLPHLEELIGHDGQAL